MSNMMRKFKLVITDELIELSVGLLNSHFFSRPIFYALNTFKYFKIMLFFKHEFWDPASRNARQTE